jgi:hypothetical protein
LEASTPLVKEVPLGIPQAERIREIDDFFKRHGDAWIGHWLVDKVRQSGAQRCAITGCRKTEEVRLLRTAFATRVVALICSFERRFMFATERSRSDAPVQRAAFAQLSGWEYSLGLGRLIYEADDFAFNDSDPDALANTVSQIVDREP